MTEELNADGVPSVDGRTEAEIFRDFLRRKYGERSVICILGDLLLPGWISTPLGAHIDEMTRRRKGVFFDELARGEIVLDEDIIKNDEFLHAFFITSAAAARSRREAKVRAFARLLLQEAPQFKTNDYEIELYEESLRAIEQLSLLDIKLLVNFARQYARQGASHRGFALRADVGIVPDTSELSGPRGRDRANRLEGMGLLRREVQVEEGRNGSKAVETWYFTALFRRIKSLLQDSLEKEDVHKGTSSDVGA